MIDRVRTTISVDPEVLEVFRRMADASHTSVSRCMGDWLSETSDAARVIAYQVEEARRASMATLGDMRAIIATISAQAAAGLPARSASEDGQAGRRLGDDLGNNTKSQAALGVSNRPQTRMDASSRPIRQRSESPAAAPLPPSSNTGGKSPRLVRTAPAQRGKK